MDKANGAGVNALFRAFRIVEALNELGGAGVSAIAREVDLPKSTVHNHLNTLEQAGYVVAEDGTYRPGLKFLYIGEAVRNEHTLYSVAQSQVDKLAATTGEISGLMVEEHGEGVFIHRGRGSEAAHIDTQIGDRIPLHCTALGKAILAFLPPEKRDQSIDRHGLPGFTPQTITDREQLYSELETVREQQVAFDDEERLPGLRSTAAPIFDGEQSVIGAISVAGPTHRMQGDRFRSELPEQVLGFANVIELNLQHS